MSARESDVLDLLERARNGDGAALDRLVEKTSEPLRQRIRMMMGASARRRADSMDFVQGAIVELLRDADARTFESERGFLRWLTSVARNNIRDAVRRRRDLAWDSFSAELAGPGEQAADGASPLSRADLAEHGMRLMEALEELQPEHREVIELRNLDELGWDEVGARIGRSGEAARQLHGRALLKLGRLLGRTEP